jgi:hypothetical protein
MNLSTGTLNVRFFRVTIKTAGSGIDKSSGSSFNE